MPPPLATLRVLGWVHEGACFRSMTLGHMGGVHGDGAKSILKIEPKSPHRSRQWPRAQSECGAPPRVLAPKVSPRRQTSLILGPQIHHFQGLGSTFTFGQVVAQIASQLKMAKVRVLFALSTRPPLAACLQATQGKRVWCFANGEGASEPSSHHAPMGNHWPTWLGVVQWFHFVLGACRSSKMPFGGSQPHPWG